MRAISTAGETVPAAAMPITVRNGMLTTSRPTRAITTVALANRTALPRLLGVIAIPATHMELGLPNAGSDPEDTTTRQAYDLLEKGFGPGLNGPLTVVVDAPNLPAGEQWRIATAVTEELEGFDGVAAVAEPTQYGCWGFRWFDLRSERPKVKLSGPLVQAVFGARASPV
ncbi:MAG: putative drug exporter of the superfamily [Solirubrobacteraceae bacterium]